MSRGCADGHPIGRVAAAEPAPTVVRVPARRPPAPDGPAADAPAPWPAALRRGVLMVSVLCDVDVQPGEAGVILPGSPPVRIPWTECHGVLAGHDPEGEAGRQRLRRWLQARRWSADLSRGALVERLRPVGLPVDHLLHPGPDWVHQRVLGGALELGLGALGLDPDDPEAVVLLPPAAAEDAGIDAEAAWREARSVLEALGALAATLVARDTRGRLRPVGDADVVTLLGARSLRVALARESGGMASAVVPMRRRGWTRLALVDAAFGPAAAAATDPSERGFPRPLLITADEVAVVAAGGDPEVLALGAVDGRHQGRPTIRSRSRAGPPGADPPARRPGAAG